MHRRKWLGLGTSAAAALVMAGATLGPLAEQAAAAPAGGVLPGPPADQITGPTVVATGDIACDPADKLLNGGAGTAAACRQRDVAQSIRAADPDVFIPLGDIQYENGTYEKFIAVYDKDFGSLKSISKPIPGNHEYMTAGGAGYYQYFGEAAAPANKGTYSYDIGPNWHVIALNSMVCTDKISCGPGTPMAKWIAADMARNSKKCVMAVWHHPVWSAGAAGDYWPMADVWNQLNSYGVDLALHGHDHLYQRTKPLGQATVTADLTMAPPQVAPDGDGMRSFIIGTGGENNMRAWEINAPGIREALDAYATNPSPAVFGSTKFTLGDGAYSFSFLPAPGTTFQDSGTASCRTKTPVPNAPTTPENVKVERAGDGAARISWDAGVSPAAAPVTYTARVAGSARTCSATGSTCTITGLTNGKSYSITVTAANTVADLPSSAMPFVPAVPPTTPGAPVATVAGTVATLNWAPPTYAGGVPVSSYRVSSNVGGKSCLTAGEATCQITGLTPGVAYYFTVTAASEAGTSRVSAASNVVRPVSAPAVDPTQTPIAAATSQAPTAAPTSQAPTTPPTSQVPTPAPTSDAPTAGQTPTLEATPTTPVAGKPGAPSIASLTRTGDGRVMVSVVPAAADGAAEVTSFRVVAAPSAKSCVITTPATQCEVSGLVNGTQYTFNAYSRNTQGESPASATSAPLVAGRVATRPQSVSSVAGPDGTMTVKWAAPDWDGGLPIQRYRATSTSGVLSCTATAGMSCVVKGVTAGKSYSFTVTAENEAGVSTASAGSPFVVATSSAAPTATPAPATAGVPGKPAAPSVTGAARAGDGRVAVTVTPPTTDGGSAIIAFRVVSSPGGKTCGMIAPSRSCVVSGLANGTTYTFVAMARNAVGESVASGASTPLIAGRTATRPNAVTAVAGAGGTMAVSWKAPDWDGGLPVVGYVVRSTVGGHSCTSAGGTSCVVNGLTSGKSYSFTAAALNEAGMSPASIGSTLVAATSSGNPAVATPASPGAPQVSALTRSGDGRVTVTVAAPASDGGAAIASYRVVSAPAGKSCVVTVPAASCEVIGLTNGTAYTFTATATNAVGDSVSSPRSVAMVAGRVATRPSSVTALAGEDATATVSWKAPDWDGGLAVQRYSVSSTAGGLTCSTTNATTMSCVVTGLTVGKAYSFTVTATNEAGVSAASPGSSLVTARS